MAIETAEEMAARFERLSRWRRRNRRRRPWLRMKRRLTPGPISRRQHQRMLERCELVNLRLKVTYLNTLLAFARRERDELRAT